jgi:polyferredoxin
VGCVTGFGVPTWEILAPLAAGMAAATAFILRWAADARGPLHASAVVFLLLMMVAMIGGAAFYFLRPGTASLVGGLWIASGLMSVSAVVVFLGFLREVHARIASGAPSGPGPSLAHPRVFLGTVIGLVVVNELLMGWTFQAASGPVFASSWSGVGVLTWISGSVNSSWFLFTMSAEMLLTVFLLRARLPRPVLFVLASQSLIMLLSPPALNVASWVDGASYAASAVMIALFVYLMEHLYRHRQLATGISGYIVLLLGIYGLMMAGLYLWIVYGVGIVFAASVLVEMAVFFAAVLRPEAFASAPARPWLERPNWTFAVLAGIFVAEIFMGAVLDVQIEPATYLGAFGSLPLAGSPWTVLTNAVSNGFWFLATVAGSTWFLAMMGIEMGALVAYKFKETRHLENRIRLLLMMGSYAAFAVFYPSVYFGLLAPQAPNPSTIPVLGWSMGIGSYPLATTVFLAVLLTYAITGALIVLFGRRVVCSVFCTAPLMYQGTAIDSMKAFNRTGPLGRKYQSSRLSVAFSVTAGLVLASLVLTSLVSYLNTIGVTQAYIDGTDPTVFFFALYFSVLWYVLFVSIPYAGNYNCVTMGWCYTGLISQAFHKIGFSKLKVESRQVCRDCTTLDCARGCPIGLVDMPGHFRTEGEFRSSKCCGVGECVEACPYGNLYIYDVRHWIRERLGRPTRPRPTRLPMIPSMPQRTPAVAVAPARASPPD